VLPTRVAEYAPSLLDHLCFAGVVTWGRFSSPVETAGDSMRRRRAAPTRSAPLGLALRDDVHLLLGESAPEPKVSRGARDALAFLDREGASFLGDVARGTGLLPTAAEEALWELVARGLVSGDGFAGLRTLLTPEERRPERRLRAVRGGRGRARALPVGRWARLKRSPATTEDHADERVEAFARKLVGRWGVVMREILARETLAPPWRALVGCLRRFEARGELRGGRFVSGLIGEQFASPEAVEALRATRRLDDSGDAVLVSAADPLNLIGILAPGARISPQTAQVIAYRRGVAVEVGELGAVRSRLARATA
jgi:ATP-dependent Lhr-like helicase